MKVKIYKSNPKYFIWKKFKQVRKKSSIDLSNIVKKDIQSSLKFVYSENNSLSVIFHEK